MARVIEPAGDLVRVEADESPPPDVGDASLCDETADVTRADSESLGQLVDREELGQLSGGGEFVFSSHGVGDGTGGSPKHAGDREQFDRGSGGAGAQV